MRISIYEPTHQETALALILILDGPDRTLTLFVSDIVARHLHEALGRDAARHQWIIQKAGQHARTFIAGMRDWCREHQQDLIILSTVENNHLPMAMALKGLKGTRALLMVHDVHNYFSSRPRPSLRGIVRHIGKRALLRRVSGFMSISEGVRDHLQTFVKDGRPVIHMPGAVFVPGHYRPAELTSREAIRVVVPGSYDMRRRDYQSVFDAAGALEAVGVDTQIVLLGGPGPDTDRILSWCRARQGKHVRFTGHGVREVEESVFAKEMTEAHFIWVPSVIHTTISDGIPEVYGLSKSSGNIFDAVRFARPLLVPKALAVDPTQRSACFHYASKEDLVAFLQAVKGSPEAYTSWRDKALEVASRFTVAAIRERTPALFDLL